MTEQLEASTLPVTMGPTRAPRVPFADRPLRVVEASRGWPTLGLRELWRYRELLYFLTWRDVKVKYKQTIVGLLWVIIQPLATMLLFTFVFGRLAKLPSDSLPYPLFSLTGLLPWQLFNTGLTASSTSVVSSSSLVSKVYFPRLVIPLASVLAGLIDLGVSLVMLMILMSWYGYAPGWSLVALPAFVVLALLTALGVGIWFASLNVRYRDVQYTIPFLLQLWLFVTPIAYASSLIPSKWRWLFGLNPLTSVVDGFRWALLGHAPSFGGTFVASIVVVFVTLVAGLFFFRRTERTFADVI